MKQDAINALHEIADEAAGNGNSEEWIGSKVKLIMAAIEQPLQHRINELEQLLAIENERAAVICTSIAPSRREFDARFYDACYVCADAIRAAKYREQTK